MVIPSTCLGFAKGEPIATAVTTLGPPPGGQTGGGIPPRCLLAAGEPTPHDHGNPPSADRQVVGCR